MEIHIVTPFYRKHLLKTLIGQLEPMKIQWHPVCDSVDIEAFADNTTDWIHPLLVPPLGPKPETAHRKCNDFLDKVPIVDEDYYCFLGDDDMYEPGFFDVVRDVIENEHPRIIMCSLYRGDTTPGCDVGHHPTDPLIIRNHADVRVCRIGLPQYIVNGEILKQVRFDANNIWGDGYLAEDLKKRFPNDIKFLPDMWVFGGYYQPGRFTTPDRFMKQTWRMPETI